MKLQQVQSERGLLWLPSYALQYSALWGCLSATEHSFVFNVFPVVLHTISTPKSTLASCVWCKHLMLVLELLCLASDFVNEFAQP